MITVNVDYNNLSAQKKAQAERVRIVVSNHPDYPGQKVKFDMPKALWDLISA